MRVSPAESVNDQHAARAPHESVVCPYCGHTQTPGSECASCRGLFEPLSKQATQNAMGPWRIRDETTPFRPPCSHQTLQTLIKRGRITADSVISGPTTRQFWARAADTPGVAHLLGQCHHCHAPADASDALCTGCGASFLVDEDRNFLGLSPIRPLAPEARSQTTPVPAPGRGPKPSHPVDLFAGLAASPEVASRARHSRMPVAILITALAVAAGAMAVAVVRWSGTSPTQSGGGTSPIQAGPASE